MNVTVLGSARRRPVVRRRVAAVLAVVTGVFGLVVSAQPALAASAGRRPDLDGDGKADLAAVSQQFLGVRLGTGQTRASWVYSEYRSFFHNVVAGDFDADGYDDLAVGDPLGEPDGDCHHGVVWVFPGGPKGSAIGDGTKPTVKLVHGENELPEEDRSEYFGTSLAAGDVTGDGVDDLVAGASMDHHTDSVFGGSITVMPGGSGGLTLSSAKVITQDTPGVPGTSEDSDRFGAKVAVGDVTGDGLGDIAVGIPRENGVGSVVVVPGRRGGPTGAGSTAVLATSLKISGAKVYGGPGFGGSLAVGDLTGDGRAEVLVGAASATVGTVKDSGKVAVLRGAVTGISATRAQVVSQATTNVVGTAEAEDHWGETLAVGDLTGDGRAELVVGAPYEAVGTVEAAGAYTVLRATSTGVTGTGSFAVSQNTTNVPGSAEVGDWFAGALALVDVNGDGRRDVVAGAPSEMLASQANMLRQGAVSVQLSGTSGRPAAGSFAYNGAAFSSRSSDWWWEFGSAVAAPVS